MRRAATRGALIGALLGLLITPHVVSVALALRELEHPGRRVNRAWLGDLLTHDEAVSDELLRTRLEAIARLAERHGYTPVEYLEAVAGGRSPAT